MPEYPKFSIIIPAYKQKYLKECIDSIICQSYSNFELIIVNDASPENLNQIVSIYKDYRIKYYVNEKNYGSVDVVNNWNKCLSYCSGDYVICMGDDDRLLPYCLDVYVELIAKYPNLGVYHGRTDIIDENSDFVDVTEVRPNYESVYSLIWHRWKGREQFIGDFLFDIRVLREFGGFYYLPLAWGSDDLTAIIAASKNGIANTNIVVFEYRKSRYTISSGGKCINDKYRVDALRTQSDWFTHFLKKEPDNPQDKKYRISLINMQSRKFREDYIAYIAKDLFNKSFRSIIYWLKKKKDYSLTAKDILISFFYALNAKSKQYF